MPRGRALRHGLVVALGAAPAALLAVRAATTGLGANPIEAVTHTTGEWSLRWLLVALAITPARRWLGIGALAPLRRTCGLVAFTWVCLHLLTWVAVDQFFDLHAMWEDVVERRFITVGFSAFLCLLPLAITSTRRWQKRLGARWVRLHRLAYAAGVLAVLHYLWLAKADLLEPFVYAGVLLVLLGARAPGLGRRRPPDRASPLAEGPPARTAPP